MLRAEILAEGVRAGLPQPLVKPRAYKPNLLNILQYFHLCQSKR